MPNYYYTRLKIGRKKYLVSFLIIGTIFGWTQWILNFIFGYAPEEMKAETEFLNLIVGGIGNIMLLSFIEIISNMNYNLLITMTKKGVIIGDPQELEEKAIKFLWTKYVYALALLIYSIPFTIITIAVLTGRQHILSVITGYPGFMLSAILYAEVGWIMFGPIFIIALYLPRHQRIQLNVFDSDLAGGLNPIANYLLKISLMLTLLGTLALYWISQGLATEELFILSLLVLMGILILPLLYFILPTIGLNQIMRKQKCETLSKLDAKIQQIYEIYKTNPSTIDDSLMKQMQMNEMLIQKVRMMRESPFSLRGLRNLLTSFLLPIGVFVLNNLESLFNLF
ncbi:MAG: hypothetical protein ACFFCU_20545 [Promethearchaeota archaeon]